MMLSYKSWSNFDQARGRQLGTKNLKAEPGTKRNRTV